MKPFMIKRPSFGGFSSMTPFYRINWNLIPTEKFTTSLNESFRLPHLAMMSSSLAENS